jgi:hypothetical protein
MPRTKGEANERDCVHCTWIARSGGPATGGFVAGLLERRPHPEQGYRACLSLMRLGRVPGADRLEAACLRAERAPIAIAPSNTFSRTNRIGSRSTSRLRARCSRTTTCAAPRITRRSMLTHPTIEKLHALHLTAMARRLISNGARRPMPS